MKRLCIDHLYNLSMLRNLLLPALLFAYSAAFAQAHPDDQCKTVVANSLQAFSRGDVADASKNFDEALKKTHDETQMGKVWDALLLGAGTFQQIEPSRVENIDRRVYVMTEMIFSKGTVESIGACDAGGYISFYEWSRASDAEEKIAAAKPQIGLEGIRIIPMSIPSQWGPLPAILTLPKGKGPFPAAVLVAGAGPNDENESLGPNKPFEDLANGLAAYGVASLRYDKSIRAYPAEAGLDKELTIDDEVTNDAVTALKILRSAKSVNCDQVFVLGHSLGAMMVPRIVERSSWVAGAIMMAPPAESILENGMQQTRYIGDVQKTPTAELQKQLASLNQEEKLLAQTPSGQTPPGQFMGMPQTWWMSLYRYDQVKEAQSLKIPLLIVQGAADFQVAPQGNFTRWQTVFSGQPRVTLKEYPSLSHVFMPAGDPPSPADYNRPSTMDSQVIGDIAAWIKEPRSQNQ